MGAWARGEERKEAEARLSSVSLVHNTTQPLEANVTPRCIRHFAIYQQAWPVRTPAPGSVISWTPRDLTPADNTAKSSKKVLKYLKRQAEEATVLKKRQREETDNSPRPQKKMKVSDKIVIKVKTTTPINSSQRRGVNDEQPIKRKRGRPRLSSPRYRSKAHVETEVVVKVEEESVEASLKRTFSQPRATNGRFGRKDKPQRRPSDTATPGLTKSPKSPKNKSDKRADEPSKGTWTSPRRKRGNDAGLEELEDDRRRKVSRTQSDDLDAAKSHQKVMPRRTSGFKGGSLLSNPNPLRFALHAWAGPVVLDESSSEDDSSAPDTPEDILSPAPEIVTVEDDELSASALLPAPPALHAPLIYKPSPFAFSKRRWVALSGLPERLASARKQVPKDERQDDDDDDADSCEGDKTATLSQSKTASYSSRWPTKSFLVDNDVSSTDP